MNQSASGLAIIVDSSVSSTVAMSPTRRIEWSAALTDTTDSHPSHRTPQTRSSPFHDLNGAAAAGYSPRWNIPAPRDHPLRGGLVTSRNLFSEGRRWAAVPLRLVVGYGFIAHGVAKVVNGPSHFADSLRALGIPAAQGMSWLTIGVELVGGLAVLAGAWIPLVGVPLAAVLVTAAVTVHLPYGFTSIKLRAVTQAGPQFGPPGYETNLLYLAALATLALGGPGPLALRRARKEGPQ